MSLRQTRRAIELQRQANEKANDNSLLAQSDSEDSVGSGAAQQASNQRYAFSSDDDSSNSDSSDEEESNHADVADDQQTVVEINFTAAALPQPTKAEAVKAEEQVVVPLAIDEDEWLEAMFKENQRSIAEEVNDDDSTILCESFFEVDARNLDLDLALRNRFVGEQLPDIKARKGSARIPKKIFIRKFIFGAQKEDWSKPPAFITGGIGMVRCAEESSHTLFRFQWSEDYHILNSQFKLVQESGDANVLVMFLANYPYHSEGLLMLAHIFARTGRNDRATDLVRRCLYCFECAFMEAFKPYNGRCRLDPALPENRTFFHALYRYMLLAAVQKHFSLACNLASIILALNPFDEACSILLHLDYLMLHAGRYAAVQDMCGYALPLPHSTSSLAGDAAEHWRRCYVIDACETVAESIGICCSIEQLPSWWFSLALSVWLQAEQQTQSSALDKATADQHKQHASQLLCQAITRWPSVLLLLYEQVAASSPMLKALRAHAYFNTAQQRLPTGSYLQGVCEVYVLRHAAIWSSRPELMHWLNQCAQQLLTSQALSDATLCKEMMLKQGRLYQQLAGCIELQRYGLLQRDDFTEQVARLPDGLEPVDAHLADPRVLAGGVRFPELDSFLETHQIHQILTKEEVGLHGSRRTAAREAEGVDLSRPLLQLFFATFLPWVHLPRHNRRQQT